MTGYPVSATCMAIFRGGINTNMIQFTNTMVLTLL